MFQRHDLPWPGGLRGFAAAREGFAAWGDEGLFLARSPHDAPRRLSAARGIRAACFLDRDNVAACGPDGLVLYGATDRTRHTIDRGGDAADLLAVTLLGRRGVLAIHKRMQVRFYEAPDWQARDLYSVYTPSWQGGLALADIDGDGRPDILCGNYWIRSPERLGLPWRLFAINTWTETEPSGMLSLAWADGALYAAQREMAAARLARFERPPDPRQLWREAPIAIEPALDHPSLDAADFLLVAEAAGQGRLIIFAGGKPEVIARGAPVAQACAANRDVLAIRNGKLEWWENRGGDKPRPGR